MNEEMLYELDRSNGDDPETLRILRGHCQRVVYVREAHATLTGGQLGVGRT